MLERFSKLRKEILGKIEHIRYGNVSPNNRLVSSYFFGLDDNYGTHVSKRNRIVHSKFGEIENTPSTDTDNPSIF